ncbi:restriction endonuclease [Candidatus Parcubacteria bacterium]|nr:restriction endonuclease [Candidatus Parcubacteria bacterium]
MDHWLKLSIQYANQRNYLDDLFTVYPTIPEGIREIDKKLWSNIKRAFDKKNNNELFENLLKLDLFPIKDSYVAYFKRDITAIDRNPQTVNRLCGRIYEMGLDKMFLKCSEPKETNRQIGPLFRRWLDSKALGIQPLKKKKFLETKDSAILDAGDAELMQFANEYLNYKRNKGLDFIGRFNGKYVIGEAKFLTDFGGHQNAQFADAISTVKARGVKAEIIAILDGVLYIKGKNKLYTDATIKYKKYNIMSALVLREFLYQL